MTAHKQLQNSPPAPLAAVAAVLRRATRVLAMCHISPDGDAIGALLGLAWVLRGLPHPPELHLACADPVPPALRFLPGAGEIHRDVPAPPVVAWDAVVCLDASHPDRLGPVYIPPAYQGHGPVIVLDHHITNQHFGDLNHVDTGAAATSQIVVQLADALDVPISANAAICLLAGIVTDTLSFRTSNVTPELFITAARLMTAGADVAAITQRTLYDRPTGLLRLWGAALSQVQLDGGVIWTTLTQAMRRQAGLLAGAENGLTSQLINASEAVIAAVFNETEEHTVEVSLRSRPGYDVATVAARLGGGGHPQAAGCTLPGPLAEAQARVLPLLAATASRAPRDR